MILLCYYIKYFDEKRIKMNEKRLNIICYTTIIMFFVYTFFYIILGSVQIKREEQRVDALYNYANSINKQAEKENLIFKDETTEEEDVVLLYTEETKLKAIIEGYNRTINSNSFIADVNGDLTLELPAGLSAKVKMRNFCVKYSQKKSFIETTNYVSDVSSIIAGIMRSRSQYGQKQKIENGNIQAVRTPNVTFSNNEMQANYSGYSYADSDDLSILDNLYIVNEETIQEVTYFKVKMKNGKPSAYYIQATLDPVKATERYAGYIADPVGSVPTFKSVKVTVVLNTKGEMIAATSVDEFTATSEGFNFTASLTNNYALSCIGEQIIKEYS